MNTEQTRAIMHGLDTTEHWSLIDLPVGPQPIPTWALDLSIEWADGFGNAPRFRLKTDRSLRDWEGKRFRKDGSRFMAESADGRAEIYYHAGPVRLTTLTRFDRGVSKTDGTVIRPARHVEYEGLATTKQDGFGGAHITCEMFWPKEYRGQTIVLRGPWHGVAPEGWEELAYVDVSRWKPKCQWHKVGGIGGLYLRQELFFRIFARFCPHLRLARCTYNGATTVEPLKPEWDKPKHWVLADEYAARQAAVSRVAS